MSFELIGMSNDKLIQWACEHGRIDEDKLRWRFPPIKRFCAVRKNPIGLEYFIYLLVQMTNEGMSLNKAIRTIKRMYK